MAAAIGSRTIALWLIWKAKPLPYRLMSEILADFQKDFGVEEIDHKPEDIKNVIGDIQDIIDGIPNPPKETLKVIYEWQEYLDNYQYQTEQIDIEQTIREIKKGN